MAKDEARRGSDKIALLVVAGILLAVLVVGILVGM